MSGRPHHHRRRSHSTSSPLTSPRHLEGDKWRPSLKRARPTTSTSPSYNVMLSDQPPHKWDVEMWRRGKRPRKGSSANRMSVDEVPPCTPSSPIRFFGDFTIPARLPSTSEAFQFFPSRSKRSYFQSPEGPTLSERAPLTSPLDIDRLRSDAFNELHRSVAESGEGLIRRMRDWEGSLSSLSASHSSLTRIDTPHVRSHHSSSQEFSCTPDLTQSPEDDEDDDIQIVSGDASFSGTFAHWVHPHKKRALSMSVMEMDHASIDDLPSAFVSPESSDRCSSPVDLSISETSALTSDDECGDAPVSRPPFQTPALTSNSANSSLVSLSLPPLSRKHSHSPSQHTPSTASREEKAIAALSLAMANGAAGLNDYADIRLLEESRPSTMDESLIGEMWH